MEQFELVLKEENGNIITNAKELMDEITPKLKKYNYVVDRTNYSQAKQDRASLNGLVDRVSTERKRIEEKVFGQWKQDKKDLMALEKKVKSTADDLGIGIKALDDEEKERKEMALEEMWYQMSDYSFDLIFNQKWLNKSYSEKQIKTDMEKIVESIALKKGIVETFLPKDALERQRVLDVFNKTLDPTLAKVEAEKIEAEKRAVEQVQEMKPEELDQGFEQQAQPSQTEEGTYYCQFTVSGSRDQLLALQNFMNENRIMYLVDRKWKE